MAKLGSGIMTAAAALVFTSAILLSSPAVEAAAAKTTGAAAAVGWLPAAAAKSGCHGGSASIEACLGVGGEAPDEFGMESEVSRRILQQAGGGQQYISYGSLSADRVACGVAGAPYYNCVAGAASNPYNRGCSVAALCRTS